MVSWRDIIEKKIQEYLKQKTLLKKRSAFFDNKKLSQTGDHIASTNSGSNHTRDVWSHSMH